MKLAAAVLLIALPCSPTFASPPQERLFDFEIEDQFRQTHRRADYQDRALVVIGSDRHGSAFNGAWGQAIHEALVDAPGFETIAFLPLADLRGVPFFIKGMIRRKFPQARERWALMDWKGQFPGAYPWVPRESNILVFDRQGVLAHHGHGTELDPPTLEAIVGALRELLPISPLRPDE